MAKEAVEKIRQAESDAAEREKKASIDAQNRITDAKSEAQKIITDAERRQHEISLKEIKKAEQEAEIVLENARKEALNEVGFLKQKAYTMQDELNRAVLEIIMN